ncbi:unnamed protein product [Amoebophrya sp. A25]|nr:unnamed protein product [Amoebophrya sp. A25]|eukprot:GSA25T00008594001.1
MPGFLRRSRGNYSTIFIEDQEENSLSTFLSYEHQLPQQQERTDTTNSAWRFAKQYQRAAKNMVHVGFGHSAAGGGAPDAAAAHPQLSASTATISNRDDLAEFGNSLTLLCGIALLLYGMQGSILSWRGCMKCRVLMRSFGFFQLRERQRKAKERQAAGEPVPEDEEDLSSVTPTRKEKADCIRNILRFGEMHMSEMMSDVDETPSHIFKGTWLVACLIFMQVRFMDMHFLQRELQDVAIPIVRRTVLPNGGSGPRGAAPKAAATGARAASAFLQEELSEGRGPRQALLEVEVSAMGDEVEAASPFLERKLGEDEFSGEWNMEKMAGSSVLQAGRQAAAAGAAVQQSAAGAPGGGAAQAPSPPSSTKAERMSAFDPWAIMIRYILDVIRVFCLVAGLLFCVFIPRAKRKDYWVNDLPKDVTHAEVRVLLENRNVSWIPSDMWHGWSAVVAGTCGIVSAVCLIFDIWTRSAIGGYDAHEFIVRRKFELVQIERLSVSGAPIPPGELPADPTAFRNLLKSLQKTDFAFYDPNAICEGANWKSGGFATFMQCAPFLPGERMWSFLIVMRCLALVGYFWSVASMMLKFKSVEIGSTRFYRGLRAEVAIVKLASWEAGFIAVGYWYTPHSLSDYFNYAEKPSLQVFLLLITFGVLSQFLWGLFCAYSDLIVDFEYPDWILARKFDGSWGRYEDILMKQLFKVHHTRVRDPGRERFAELLAMPPEDLQVGQVFLYQAHPELLRHRVASRLMPSQISEHDVEENDPRASGGSHGSGDHGLPAPEPGSDFSSSTARTQLLRITQAAGVRGLSGQDQIQIDNGTRQLVKSTYLPGAPTPGSLASHRAMRSVAVEQALIRENNWLDPNLVQVLAMRGDAAAARIAENSDEDAEG